MANKTMHHVVIGSDTFEIVDQYAREHCVTIDSTLTQSGQAADAKTVGDAVDALDTRVTAVEGDVSDLKEDLSDVKSALGAEIDVGTLLDGFYVHKNNGRAYESNASCATDFISIVPGAQLHFSGLYLVANQGVCFYDSDKAFISSVPFSEFTTEISATAPTNAMYVRASGRYGDPVFIEYTNSVNWLSGQIVALHDKDSEFAADFLQSEVDLFNCFEGSVAVPIRSNEMFNANQQQFVPNPNRISTETPVKVKKGDKLSFIVGESEKYYIAYFNKVGSTGDKNTDYQYIAGSGSGWKTASAEYSIDADKYAYITIANSDDSAISPTIENTVVTLVRDISSNNGDSLPDYWQSYLDTKASAINAALNDIGGDGDGFIFFTDVHWTHNQKFTPFIIDKLRSKTTLHSVFCGGDIFDTSTGGFESYMQAFRSLPVLTARGNHDQNPIATDSSDIVSDAEFYNMILRPVVYDAELSNQIYFYKDNNAQKIRYIFTDSGCNWIATLDSTQLSWLRERITELDSDWSCLVVQHIVFNGAASDVGSLSFAGQGNTLINAINDMWSAINCTFLGIVSGHVHRDYSVYDATHNYPIIATSCDANGTTRTDYDPLNTGESGTTNEHILDVFLIDKTNRTIKTIRIGSGSDRTFTY